MASTDQTFRASCKLMLFGEYLVLKGSKSLAFPLKFGQKLEVKAFNHPKWTGISPSGIWFTAQFDKDLNVTITSNENSAKILRDLFLKIKEINPAINLNQEFKTTADFKLEWGLGSSSTLLSLLSQWSNVDPYLLLESSFGGSGYDVACASAKSPILYEIESRKVEEVQIPIEISSKLLFVYLDKKQSSLKE
ncbi:MAG: mevalonate kinase, partial [Arenicella sp.]